LNQAGSAWARDPLTAPPLRPGDKIAVVAPAGAVSRDQLEAGLSLLGQHYRVSWDEALLRTDGYLAGSDKRRLTELQAALDDPETAAVIAVRGGFGTTRILDQLRLDHLRERPKWFVGSSDLTALHLAFWSRLALHTIHGPMVVGLGDKHSGEFTPLVDLLEGRRQTDPLDLESAVPGEAQGPLVGGNLTVLAHLTGTLPPHALAGAILFLEDVGEAPYRLERCLVQLKRSGLLGEVAGVLLGDFTDCTPGEDGVTPRQALTRVLADLTVPVAARYPAAHGAHNRPFVHGARARLRVEKSSATLSF
jgi:muramoyltetrapeptide carboxypeptidase